MSNTTLTHHWGWTSSVWMMGVFKVLMCKTLLQWCTSGWRIYLHHTPSPTFSKRSVIKDTHPILPQLSPSGDLHDCSRHNANLLQLPPCQTCHKGGDQEWPVRCQAHPQAHWRMCIQDLWSLGQEGPNSEQSSTFREHSQSHPAVVGGWGRRTGPPCLVMSTSGPICWNFMGTLLCGFIYISPSYYSNELVKLKPTLLHKAGLGLSLMWTACFVHKMQTLKNCCLSQV